jgi:type II secretory pathway pseudopilin PulG
MIGRISKRRGAFSLAEMLVVMSVCTVILTMSTSIIQRAMQAQLRTRSYFDVERNALRLSDQFRRDVHQATAADVANSADSGVLLRLALPSGQIVEYRHAEGMVLRTLSRSGASQSHEEYSFTSSTETGIREENAPRRFVLTIASDPHEEGPVAKGRPGKFHEPPVSVRVEASLGRDWWFAETAADQEQQR